MGDLSQLFVDARHGDAAAFDAIFALLYDDLAALARARLRKGQRATLADTGALVHETWLRLQRAGKLGFDDRGHFMAHAARVMRSVVTDIARRSLAERRGGGLAFVTLDTEAGHAVAVDEPEVLAVAEAVEALARVDPRLAQVVEMRWFAGLLEADIAAAMGVNERTVRRDWEKARAYLQVALRR